MDERKSDAWKNGYAYGCRMNLNSYACEPDGYTDDELREWNMGVNAAICDRLS